MPLSIVQVQWVSNGSVRRSLGQQRLGSAGHVAHPVGHGVDIGHDERQGIGSAEAAGRSADEKAVEHLALHEWIAEISLQKQHTYLSLMPFF